MDEHTDAFLQFQTMHARDAILFAILLGTLATLFAGYQYGTGDQVEQTPYVLRAADPSFAPTDPTVNASEDYGPRHNFARIFGLLGRVAPLPVVYLLLTWAMNVLIVGLTYAMARDFFRRSDLAAALACTLVMAVEGFDLGGLGYVVWREFAPSLLSRPLALASLWLAFKGRPLAAGVLCAANSFIHPLIGVEVGGIALAAAATGALWDRVRPIPDTPRRTARELLATLGGLLVLSLTFTLLWVRPMSHPLDTDTFVDLMVRLRHPHHSMPSEFGGPLEYGAAAAFLLAALVSWTWWYRADTGNRRAARRVLPAIVVVVLAFAGGYVFVELIPTRAWASAMSARMTFVLKWLGLILFGGTAARILEGSREFGHAAMGWLLLIGAGFAQPFVALWAHVAEGIRGRWEYRLTPAALGAVAGLALLVALMLLADFGSSFVETMALAFGLAVTFLMLLATRPWRRIGLPILLVVLLVGAVVLTRYVDVPILSSRLRALQPVMSTADWRGPEAEAARWARENTPPDALFLAPPEFGRFRLAARRGLVVDFKSFPWQDEDMLRWKERLDDCYGGTDGLGFDAARRMDARYHEIGEERILAVALKYGATYAVLYADTPTELPVIYRNDAYKVVRLNEP